MSGGVVPVAVQGWTVKTKMIEFIHGEMHKARKEHYCEYCLSIISIGDKYKRTVGKDSGEFFSYALCERCAEALYLFDVEEFGIGDFQEEINTRYLLECPNCHKNNSREYEYTSPKKLSMKLVCDCCDHEYTVDLSEEALRKYVKEGNK